MNKYILLISFALLVAGLSHAAEDPMKSLFTFQQTMANKGSTTAMMKLGEMYEQGLGTKQDFGKAIEMYRKAKARGYVGADAAIARVIRTRQTLADTSRRRKQQTAEERRRIQERQRAEAEREARAKARQQALARKRAEQARREAQARAHAQAQARAHAEEVAQARAAAEARRQAQQQARQQQAVGVHARKQPVLSEKKASDNKTESFKSDPCKGPAARVMSICK